MYVVIKEKLTVCRSVAVYKVAPHLIEDLMGAMGLPTILGRSFWFSHVDA